MATTLPSWTSMLSAKVGWASRPVPALARIRPLMKMVLAPMVLEARACGLSGYRDSLRVELIQRAPCMTDL
ncbi:amidohydrolase family protein [Colletotrichum asianum]